LDFHFGIASFHAAPFTTMKSLLILPVLAAVFAAVSCRTSMPLDPHTMRPSEKCLPENVAPFDAPVRSSK
jgi:hypothetical protein